MHFLLSGEGPTDLGRGEISDGVCPWEHFRPGPMTHVVAGIVREVHDYSILDFQLCLFVDDGSLSTRAHDDRPIKIELPGVRRRNNTLKFHKLARALAAFAREQSAMLNDVVVAVLFRDSDESGTWREKFDAMLDGFKAAAFQYGAPMIPDPISEAWILESLGEAKLSASPKHQLETLLGESPNSETLNRLFAPEEGAMKADIAKIAAPSFIAFRERLRAVITM